MFRKYRVGMLAGLLLTVSLVWAETPADKISVKVQLFDERGKPVVKLEDPQWCQYWPREKPVPKEELEKLIAEVWEKTLEERKKKLKQEKELEKLIREADEWLEERELKKKLIEEVEYQMEKEVESGFPVIEKGNEELIKKSSKRSVKKKKVIRSREKRVRKVSIRKVSKRASTV